MRMAEGKRGGIRVFLVDDHPIVREGVRSFLTTHSITVVGEASDAKEALRKVKKLAPDVVVLDVNLPAIDGGELARRLRRLIPKTKLIAFSIHSSEEYVVKMARCGVQGYVTKGQPAGDLLEAIKDVFAGGLHFPAGMGDALLTPPPESSEGLLDDGALTGRELEVLTLLADGLSNKGIAAKLGISVRTSETHRENLSHKLNILTVAGLTKYAIKRGLTSLGSTAEAKPWPSPQ
jgi:two-component system, NarL family, nitrate/nitrite response regulator NarL